MKEKKHRITAVEPGSIGEEMGIVAGDVLLSINGETVEDIFDYRFLTNDEFLTLVVEKEDGEEWELEIEKDFDEDLGLVFDGGIMDNYRSCANACIFCFIDQMPPGMRPTLYFKDDDSRLSFLQGNYVTLTNMSRHDLDRIIRYRMEPINISFQTMNPELRCRMLHNRKAGEALKKVDILYEAGITMNGQIVLCKGYNDGKELHDSLEKLSSYVPVLQSLSIVPVGLTRYREGLCPLEPFTPEDAKEVLREVHYWQDKMLKKTGLHFVHASDEWYILAGEPLPSEDTYDGYLQLENGVGMLRLLEAEVREALKGEKGDDRRISGTIATGCLAAPFIERYARMVEEVFPGVHFTVIPIRNDFFGESITVSGLITGSDLKAQLSGIPLGDCLLLPCNMLRQGENVFLDDVTVQELEKELSCPVVIVDSSGEDFVKALTGTQEGNTKRRRQIYEQTGSGHSGKA